MANEPPDEPASNASATAAAPGPPVVPGPTRWTGLGGLDPAEPWTVSGWVRTTGRTSDQVLLGSKVGALKLQQWGTGKVGFTLYGAADHSFDYTLPLNQWVQLTWVTEPGRTTLYANGERVGTVDASIPLPLRSIGTEKAGLRGDLDEVTTWDEALSPEQVQADYAHDDR
ncbi:LamG domain-containing protein [Streptomyces sp. NBC_00057]|uniref:LamG domain-containing protein n=1 Tax=Streptomyces sp. NBC_00057 TaxID=2975634 RepID=UPI00324409E8